MDFKSAVLDIETLFFRRYFAELPLELAELEEEQKKLLN